MKYVEFFAVVLATGLIGGLIKAAGYEVDEVDFATVLACMALLEAIGARRDAKRFTEHAALCRMLSYKKEPPHA